MTKEEKIKLLELELAYLENAKNNGIFIRSITNNKDTVKTVEVEKEKKELCTC